ncbi:hypothetical protein RHCRD62_20689 [Rhodococcus sp. RD6.2]|nr:hypothetical protein RHCRD62_20689 [Rhodococcus sp. RD6.2]
MRSSCDRHHRGPALPLNEETLYDQRGHRDFGRGSHHRPGHAARPLRTWLALPRAGGGVPRRKTALHRGFRDQARRVRRQQR